MDGCFSASLGSIGEGKPRSYLHQMLNNHTDDGAGGSSPETPKESVETKALYIRSREMQFTGYGPKWNKCPDCGQTLRLRKKSMTLSHRQGGLKKHELVLQKKQEVRERGR